MRELIFMATLLMFLVCACDSLSDPPPVDVCNDRAGDECGHIAERECGFDAFASDSELEQCPAYRRCENAAFDSCMDELAR